MSKKANIGNVLEQLQRWFDSFDCGDHGCLYASSKTGMRTNGGCRCHHKPVVRNVLSRVPLLMAELQRMRSERQLLCDALDYAWNTGALVVDPEWPDDNPIDAAIAESTNALAQIATETEEP